MIKNKEDRKLFKICLYVFLTAGAIMLLGKLIFNSKDLFLQINQLFEFVWNAISVIIAGLITGYILFPMVNGVFNLLQKIFKKDTSQKSLKRLFNLSIMITYLLLLLIIVVIIWVIVPELLSNIEQLIELLPGYVDDIIEWYESNLKDSYLLNNEYTQNIGHNMQLDAENTLNRFFTTFFGSLVTSILSIITGIFNFSIIIAVSIYSITYSNQIKKGLFDFYEAKFGEEKAQKTKSFIQSVDFVFGQYIAAKLIQMSIMFAICQVVFLIIGLDFSTLLAFFMAVFNIIPFIGPVIGAIPAIAVGLFNSLLTGIIVLIATIIIQQIDAYIIDPNLIGDKMDISPFWVITVVVISGNLFGLVGVIVCVPVTAVIKIIIQKFIIKSKKLKTS